MYLRQVSDRGHRTQQPPYSIKMSRSFDSAVLSSQQTLSLVTTFHQSETCF